MISRGPLSFSGFGPLCGALALVVLFAPPGVAAPAQNASPNPSAARPTDTPSNGSSAAALQAKPAVGYVIGPEDVLSIVFWREPDLSGEVVVRPDGKISLPLLQDVQAAGLTPEQLAERLVQGAAKYLEAPLATVTVKQINSRKVFITGQVMKPGPYSLTGSLTVLQLIAVAGGLNEFADAENVTVMRVVGGRPVGFRFNYNLVKQRKAMSQNILLEPGDTIVVP